MLRSRAGFFALAVFALSLPCTAASQELPPEGATVAAPKGGPSLSAVLELAVEGGGDRVAETIFTDGTSQMMHAGQGATFAAGGELRPSAGSPLSLRATVGYKFVTTAADNVDIYLSRIPIEVVGSYTLPHDVRVGGGFVYHTAMRFHGGGLSDDFDFEDAPGATVELGWRWLALSYTMIDYTDEFGNEYDASSGGLSVIGTFRLP